MCPCIVDPLVFKRWKERHQTHVLASQHHRRMRGLHLCRPDKGRRARQLGQSYGAGGFGALRQR